MERYYIFGDNRHQWLLGAVLVGVIEMAMNSYATGKISDPCQTIINPRRVISRQQFAQVLAIPEGQNRAQVQQLLQDPFCRLTELQLQAGVVAQREAYPLNFLPRTRLIVFYQGNQYLGYRLDGRNLRSQPNPGIE